MGKVYLIGTGFSFEADAPLTKNILSDIQEYASQYHKNNELNPIVDKLIKPFGNLITSSKIDAESLLSVLYNKELAKRILNVTSYEVIKWRNDLTWAIMWAIGKPINNNPNPDLYDEFVRNYVKNNDSIISLNYDLVVESAFKRIQKAYDPGYNFELNKYGDNSNITKFQFQNNNLPHLIKLHGSFNWLKCNKHINNNGKTEKCEQNKNNMIWVYGEKIAINHFTKSHFEKDLINCDKCKKTLDPVIIPPQLNKTNIGKKHFQILWKQAYEDISNADEIIFIGCSLRDADIDLRNLLSFAVNESKISKITLVDKDENTINRYKKFFENGPKVDATGKCFKEWVMTR